MAAAAIQAARGKPADPVSVLADMSDHVAGTRDNVSGWAKSSIRNAWSAVNPYDHGQVDEFSSRAAELMQSAQSAASQSAAAAQVRQLLSMGISTNATASSPLDVRGSSTAVRRGKLVLRSSDVSVEYSDAVEELRVSRADMRTAQVFQRPAEAYRYTRSIGGDAEAAALLRIDRLVDDNLLLAQRLAQQEILVGAVNLDNRTVVTGYRRVIHPERSRGGSCGMCVAASDRIYKVGTLMPIHSGCHCTVSAVTEDSDPADELNSVDLTNLYRDAGGTSVAQLKRTRYRIDKHGELGPVLVPKSDYRPRAEVRRRKKASGQS